MESFRDGGGITVTDYLTNKVKFGARVFTESDEGV